MDFGFGVAAGGDFAAPESGFEEVEPGVELELESELGVELELGFELEFEANESFLAAAL